ncbi:hypothetical protein ACFSO7_06915 [Bacillus sp. CGMCC 1.16607]|uniref:hypothetical protein n=1 Tax=Bacillus sp. CGMCC 1.16607 TaxID=3351842 RepID=UPI0036304A69
MKISIFLSYPKPHLKKQEDFITSISNYLEQRGFQPRTLGVTDYDMEEPLVAIRRLMMESNGLLTIAFRRTFIEKGQGKSGTDIPNTYPNDVSRKWITSPYCHIEPAMAFQIGLPILIFREKGVIADGILEKGVTGTYLPEFDLDRPINEYLMDPEWNQLIGKWEGHVRKVVENKGRPPKLF